MISEHDHRQLDLAVRLAVRGHGHVEPNPMVGCVILDRTGTLCGAAGHRVFGGPHAEVLALAQAGPLARRGTAYITLEPCRHQGKTPPCTTALLDAGLSRVVIGARDPNLEAAGGGDLLQREGVRVDHVEHPGCRDLLTPFRTRILRRRPWVMLKWAQSQDGYLADAEGVSQWISSPTSRRMVHRERGRVDAVLTAMGTVRHDDPRLTARDGRPRRRARRIVLDRDLELSRQARLVTTLEEAPLLLVCQQELLDSPQARWLRQRGVELMGHPASEGRFELAGVMSRLLEDYAVGTILVEAGRGLMSDLVVADCVDELAVFIAPRKLADPDGLRPLDDQAIAALVAHPPALGQIHVREDDVLLRYRWH